MEIFSFDCNNYRLPVPRSPDSGDLTSVPKYFLLLIVQHNKINRFIEVIYYRVKSVKYEEYS
jgi:hypothetical protein